MDRKFTKLKDLVGAEFTVQGSLGYKWKKWDDVNKKMLVSDDYQEGYRKMYSIETDKGMLDLGPGQLGNLLEGVFREGRAEILHRTFSVKSNGKTGIDIRYYLNPVRKPVQAPQGRVDENIEGYEDLPTDW